MAAVARPAQLKRTHASGARDVGETLLSSKLQILQGTGSRRPSIALSILTGRVVEQLSILEKFFAADPVVVEERSLPAPIVALVPSARPHFLARTVYLSEAHLHDVDGIIAIVSKSGQPIQTRRLTRSAVLRKAIEVLREAVEADPAKFLLETTEYV